MFVPFLSDSVVRGTLLLMMLFSSISDGSAPIILVTVNSCEKSMTLDSGAEISVAPMEMIRSFVSPIKISLSVKKVKTFGNSTVNFFGPVFLELQICGMQLRHPFYFIDAHTPFIAGYDLMRAARLVVDVDNRMVWSRRSDFSDSDNVFPNPPVFVNNDTVYSDVMFVKSSKVQRAVASSSTASGLEVPDTHTLRHTFFPIFFPFKALQHVVL